MVTPRLTALGALDRGLLRQGRRASGLIQRGRVLSVDTDYNPPLLSVSVHLRGGQSATIRNVLTLSAVYQPRAIVGPDLTAAQADAMVTPQVGNEVLLLCPTGRAADEAYSLGLATVAAALADHADAPVNGYVKAPVTFRYSIPPEGSDRLLTVTCTSAVLGAGRRVTPTVKIDGETFRARYEYPLLGSSGTRLVSFEGLYSRTIGAGRAVVLEVDFDGDGSVPLVSWDYAIAVTDTAPASGQVIPQALAGRYPVASLFGRLG